MSFIHSYTFPIGNQEIFNKNLTQLLLFLLQNHTLRVENADGNSLNKDDYNYYYYIFKPVYSAKRFFIL